MVVVVVVVAKGLPLEVGVGVPTRPNIWTPMDNKIV